MTAGPKLEGERVVLRPATERDLPAIVAILREPSVARWWGEYDAARAGQEFLEDEETAAFVIEAEGEVAGLIQYGEETDPMYHHASIDIFLASRFQGRGLGPEAIRTLARYLFARGHHRLTIDPAADNRNAIRAYEAVGFRPVGIMRQYERGADGSWHDGLLMDLLADELRS
ncbi:MAG: GNAT family N-acetyltransferase [Hyphomicrobiales bacterium]